MFSNMLMSNKVAAAGVWSPADVFAAGELGFWFDPSDLATLFQDAGGTIPVTTVGQPVRVIKDKSGNNFHGTIHAHVATYNTDGVHHWLDVLEGTGFGITVGTGTVALGIIGFVCGIERTDTNAVMLAYTGNNFAATYSSQPSPTSSGTNSPLPIVNGVPLTIDTRIAFFNKLLSKVVVDLVGVVTPTTISSAQVFGFYLSGWGVAGKIYGAIHSPSLVAANMPSARTWMGNKVGLTL